VGTSDPGDEEKVLKIRPGETARIDLRVKRSDLNTFLTGRRMVKDTNNSAQQEINTFEMYNRDPSYILRMMMFYEVAGGRSYAHLANDYQSFVDCSNFLKTGRAILVTDAVKNANETKQGAMLLRKDVPVAGSQDQHCVIYRFVFPVKKK
jgi:hypothetical protein